MNVFRCDRVGCGAYYDELTYNTVKELRAKQKLTLDFPLYRLFSYKQNFSKGDEIHLCPRCMASLLLWMGHDQEESEVESLEIPGQESFRTTHDFEDYMDSYMRKKVDVENIPELDAEIDKFTKTMKLVEEALDEIP